MTHLMPRSRYPAKTCPNTGYCAMSGGSSARPLRNQSPSIPPSLSERPRSYQATIGPCRRTARAHSGRSAGRIGRFRHRRDSGPKRIDFARLCHPPERMTLGRAPILCPFVPRLSALGNQFANRSAARGVPDLPRRRSGPALAGMGEGADPAIADEPGDLRDCQVTLFQIAGGEIGAELVEYLVKG